MPCYRIPNTTVRLGRALELVTEEGDQSTLWDEVKDWQMLTTPEAEERQPGRARIFLVPGELQENADAKAARAAGRTYNAWHDRDPDQVGELDVPDELGELVGRATRLDYASDKWNNPGKEIEYTHDFTAGQPPLVYAHFDGDKPLGFVLVGGDMAVTPEGIA